MKAFFLILTLQLVSFSSFAQFIAGNQGEGIFQNGQVYLRDLYMKGQLENLYFGSTPNEKIQARVAGFDRLEMTGNQRRLLIQKLSDIEAVAPCLGVILSDLFYLYRWSWSNEEFPLGQDPQEVSRVPEELRRVVAKRYRSEIILQKNLWNLMPESHQVGLLIHEMLYSLVWPEKKPDGKGVLSQDGTEVYYQDVTAVRSLVSIFFSKPTVYTSSDVELLSRELDIRPDVSCARVSAYQLRNTKKVEAPILSIAIRSQAAMETRIGRFCENELKDGGQVEIEAQVLTSPYRFHERSYRAYDGIKGETGTGRQTSVKVCPAVQDEKTFVVSFDDVTECKTELVRRLFELGNPKQVRPESHCGLNN